jgi:hypothetical protein
MYTPSSHVLLPGLAGRQPIYPLLWILWRVSKVVRKQECLPYAGMWITYYRKGGYVVLEYMT